MATALRIYTRTGDKGSTGVIGGARVSKSDLRIVSYGSVDELNAHIGHAAVLATSDMGRILSRVQNDLFFIGADLSNPDRGPSSRMDPGMVAKLEDDIDLLDSALDPLANFVLPGGTEMAARLHVARAVCRRCESNVVGLMERDFANPACAAYLNRLSDLLFVMARAANAAGSVRDVIWRPDNMP